MRNIWNEKNDFVKRHTREKQTVDEYREADVLCPFLKSDFDGRSGFNFWRIPKIILGIGTCTNFNVDTINCRFSKK